MGNNIDHWYEEDEEIFVHPRDPYHRVEVLKSSRHVKIRVDGEVVAETDRPRILFETGLPPRYYFPLRKSLRMYCSLATRKRNVPTRGVASYYSVRAGGESRGAIVWYSPTPISAAAGIEGHLCFFNEKVDLEVDGEAQQRPQWS